MKILNILSGTVNWITDPKNRNIVMLAVVAILILLLLRQCNVTNGLKGEIDQMEDEHTRQINNREALLDTLHQYKNDNGTLIAQKQVLLLTNKELNDEYADLFKGYEKLKGEKVKTVIDIQYVYVDRIDSVPIYIGEIDKNGNSNLTFSDSAKYDDLNFRYFSGNIPVNVYHPDTSTWKLTAKPGTFNISMGMNLKTGLYQDPDTKKIMIRTQTDFPGITFTDIKGASIMDDPDSKKITRKLRKTWSLGLNAGYGANVNIQDGKITTGPYLGIGLSYSPKWLQWGK